jgi:hypothetical protein
VGQLDILHHKSCLVVGGGAAADADLIDPAALVERAVCFHAIELLAPLR